MLGAVSEHHVTYRRGKDGWWRASARGLRCRSRARTLRKARQQLRAKIAPLVDDPLTIDFVEDVKLPGDARKLLVQAWAARRKAKEAARRARDAARAAVLALRALKIDVRDAGDLLGLSVARVESLDAPQGGA